MNIKTLILELNSAMSLMGEDCYVEICDIFNELDVYEARGQLITSIKVDIEVADDKNCDNCDVKGGRFD